MPDSDLLQFAVDRRSDKIAHLQTQPRAALCWYFRKTREQFRITGSVTIVTGDTDCEWQPSRDRLWDSISDNGKLLWYWPQPKAPRAETEAFASQLPASAKRPPASFVLLLLHPTEVDWLQLRGDPQNRVRFILDPSGWHAQTVNP